MKPTHWWTTPSAGRRSDWFPTCPIRPERPSEQVRTFVFYLLLTMLENSIVLAYLTLVDREIFIKKISKKKPKHFIEPHYKSFKSWKFSNLCRKSIHLRRSHISTQYQEYVSWLGNSFRLNFKALDQSLIKNKNI